MTKEEEIREKIKNISEESKEQYTTYLSDNKWFLKRDHILSLRGAKCMNCGSKSKLNIHHLKYTGKYPWMALDKDLICLCEKCHKEIHDNTSDVLTTEIAYKLMDNFNKNNTLPPVKKSKFQLN